MKRLLIHLPLAALVVVIAIPIHNSWSAKRINRNESRAIALLKNLSSSQAQIQASGHLDKNENGIGEYGDFRELTLAKVISAEWQEGTSTRVEIGGYFFEAHLPGSPEERESKWRVYAWPASYGSTGKRAFMINEHGGIVASANGSTRYSGTATTPMRGAAFLPPPTKGGVESEVAVNTTGFDGVRWTIV